MMIGPVHHDIILQHHNPESDQHDQTGLHPAFHCLTVKVTCPLAGQFSLAHAPTNAHAHMHTCAQLR